MTRKIPRHRISVAARHGGRRCRGGSVVTRVLNAALVVLLAGMLSVPAAAAEAPLAVERWLLVDTRALTLTVMDGEWPQLTLHNLAIGRYGTSREKRRGDNTTPLGRFRITRIERDADFHRFIGLDYPGVERADQAYREGVISRGEHQAILAAHRRAATPPQGTALGGHIGIHGLGRGDPLLHQVVNWTKGCVALSNEQVDTLLSWVRVGMMVEIR
jgi:hypothetical protein